MAKVTGIGGFFLRAADPQALAAWYADILGIGPEPDAPEPVWMQAAGPTVFAPFPEDSDYFAADRRWMLNLRVDDLDGMMDRLKTAGVAVETRADWDDPAVGRFARIHDPEGNPIELWQPA
ncbi:glyoxalase [Oceanicola sp. 22II-s10i]|uniref:VOC family protein n=1 Tax=Oceanicola sp. 22II-s10i TaxID=1317116 RepID=UPI000B51F16A|nr:VOC family protein [Oceanicola sp. 22II-s10i]OWU86232.1 glyoxalase [Oceanicola sp. 22II-s10i]